MKGGVQTGLVGKLFQDLPLVVLHYEELVVSVVELVVVTLLGTGMEGLYVT
jgi:hypothetical protein